MAASPDICWLPNDSRVSYFFAAFFLPAFLVAFFAAFFFVAMRFTSFRRSHLLMTFAEQRCRI